MPVMIVGADTDVGRSIVGALVEPDREVRAFVSDPQAAAELKSLGVKVALGDVSDASHVGAACTNCFSVVLVRDAAHDGRERAFAPDAAAVLRGWAEAMDGARVRRAIWVLDEDPPATRRVPETATVARRQPDDVIATRVRSLDEAAEL
jgi:uncharacterized protein YbjT (DUF2867 family)